MRVTIIKRIPFGRDQAMPCTSPHLAYATEFAPQLKAIFGDVNRTRANGGFRPPVTRVRHES